MPTLNLKTVICIEEDVVSGPDGDDNPYVTVGDCFHGDMQVTQIIIFHIIIAHSSVFLQRMMFYHRFLNSEIISNASHSRWRHFPPVQSSPVQSNPNFATTGNLLTF